MNDPRFEVYPRNPLHEEDVIAPGFGWRFRAANGKISAIGGEGFTRREDAHRAIRHVAATIANLAVVVDTAGLVAADLPIVDLDADGNLL